MKTSGHRRSKSCGTFFWFAGTNPKSCHSLSATITLLGKQQDIIDPQGPDLVTGRTEHQGSIRQQPVDDPVSSRPPAHLPGYLLILGRWQCLTLAGYKTAGRHSPRHGDPSTQLGCPALSKSLYYRLIVRDEMTIVLGCTSPPRVVFRGFALIPHATLRPAIGNPAGSDRYRLAMAPITRRFGSAGEHVAAPIDCGDQYKKDTW